MSSILKSKENLHFYFYSILSGMSFIVSGHVEKDVIYQVLYANITTYLSAVSFLIICSLKISRNLHIRDDLIIRLGYTKFIFTQYATTLIMGILYLTSQLFVAFSFGEILIKEKFSIAVWAIIFYCCVIFFLLFVLNLANWHIKSIYTVLCSIFLIFIFHYGYCLAILTTYYL